MGLAWVARSAGSPLEAGLARVSFHDRGGREPEGSGVGLSSLVLELAVRLADPGVVCFGEARVLLVTPG